MVGHARATRNEVWSTMFNSLFEREVWGGGQAKGVGL